MHAYTGAIVYTDSLIANGLLLLTLCNYKEKSKKKKKKLK